MKKILFVIPSFTIGGTVVSTKNLITLLNEKGYDITLLSLNKKGEMAHLYDDIKQIELPIWGSSMFLNSWKEYNNIIQKITALFIRTLCRINIIKKMFMSAVCRSVTATKHYDVVIACQEGITTEFVSYSKVANKIAWVRCDYSRYMNIVNKDELSIYKNFSNVVCVSDTTCESFRNIYPMLKERVHAINNPQSKEYVITQSKVNDKDSRFNTDKFTIVSVGRFDPVKRFEKIPAIASFLLKNNIDFRWYIIGGGSELVAHKLEANIKEEHVEDSVICLGVKKNPLFYIENADLLVTLSSSEACPRVINEAKILHTPVVCTDFSTAAEYIENGKDGIINTIEGIKYSILDIIKNKSTYNNIKIEISKFEFDNSVLLTSIEGLING